MEHAVEADRLSGLDAERDDVLDLEVDHVADAHAVEHTVVDDLDRRTLDAEHLADERGEARHRAAHLSAEDADELVHLVVRRALVDEHAELPVPVGHHLGRVGDRGDVQAGHVGPLDLTDLIENTSTTRQ